MAKLLDGKSVSEFRKRQLKLEIDEWVKSHAPPHLVVVLVGHNPASEVYVSQKIKTCEALGILSTKISIPEEISEEALKNTVKKLAQDPAVTSILVQLPLPQSINTQEILNQIPAQKDPDFLGEQAAGQFYLQKTSLGPCTPLGVIRLLEHEKIELTGMQTLVIGRSHLVGLPLSQLLLRKNATVTVAHSKTKDLKDLVKNFELVVVAAGKPRLLSAEHFNEQAIVVDVGIHRQADGRLCGDVDFESAVQKVRAITPVPGGVGPMTICTLMENTFALHKEVVLSAQGRKV